MKVTTLGITLFGLIATSVVWGMSFSRIAQDGALAKVVLCVADQDGRPVGNARIFGGFTTGSRRDDYAVVDGITDTNGEFVVESRCTEFLRYEIHKEGYYQTEGKIYFAKTKAYPSIVEGRWQPFGNKQVVVLKKIKNPSAPSNSGGSAYHTIPAFGQWMGFDLLKLDWTHPFGKGDVSDVLVRFVTHSDTDACFKRTMELSFTNQPYAGAYVMKTDDFSEFDSVYVADTNIVFQQNFKYVFEHTTDGVTRNELGKNQYLVFRTRTRVDPKGRLLEAHYGKVYGNWKFFERDNMSIGKVVFNTNANDPNLEDAETARQSIRNYVQSLESLQSSHGR